MVTRNILVVDDEVNVCRSVSKILSRRGYAVSDATSVEDAVNRLSEQNFDLVITDLMMPKADGMELLQIVRDHYPELDVVVITGYASIDSAVRAVKLGAAGYLPKPFTPEELAHAAEKAIGERKKRNADYPKAAEAKLSDDDILDVDMPFNAREVERATSREYVEALTHSDVPLARKVAQTAYCHTGKRECRRVVTEGKECTGECPIEKKERERAAKGITRVVRRTDHLIDVDMPFAMAEVGRVAGEDYIACLDHTDMPRAGLYGRTTTAKHTVLVVDDEPIVCHSVRRILGKESCMVEEAFDVDVALRKMKLQRYDLVILDLKMPKRSGMEVLESVRRQYPDVPVVMVSGYASIANAVEATRLGAYGFVPKPFTPQELSKVAVEALAA